MYIIIDMNHNKLESFQEWYEGLTQYKSKGEYAPQKPLTILLALSKVLRKERWIDYSIDKNQLEKLISSLTNKKSNCLYPLWRLQKDNDVHVIWEVSPKNLPVNNSGDISSKDAKESQFKAGFTQEYFDFFSSNKGIAQRLILDIMEDNFPETIHDQIIDLTSIAQTIPVIVPAEYSSGIIQKPKRDPNFRTNIMKLYDHRCCFCDLKIQFLDKAFPMEAAHIKWKAQGGECSEENGLSLCPTHHLTFDRGLWTLDQDYKILMSEKVTLQKNDFSFRPFNGKSILDSLINKNSPPSKENIIWHRTNIFKE